MIVNQARQGDVLLMRSHERPIAIEKAKDPRGCVLAEGEVTGHHHRIRDPGVALLRAEGTAYDLLRIDGVKVVSLVHEEHGPIPIGGGAGTFEVRIQREHVWNAEAEEMARQVAD